MVDLVNRSELLAIQRQHPAISVFHSRHGGTHRAGLHGEIARGRKAFRVMHLSIVSPSRERLLLFRTCVGSSEACVTSQVFLYLKRDSFVPGYAVLSSQLACYLHCCVADPGRDEGADANDSGLIPEAVNVMTPQERLHRSVVLRSGRCSICRRV